MIKYEDYISVDQNICHGQLCFRGTRILVYVILELLEAGETPEQILKSYPNLTKLHIQAALHLVAEMLKNEEYIPLTEAA